MFLVGLKSERVGDQWRRETILVSFTLDCCFTMCNYYTIWFLQPKILDLMVTMKKVIFIRVQTTKHADTHRLKATQSLNSIHITIYPTKLSVFSASWIWFVNLSGVLFLYFMAPLVIK